MLIRAAASLLLALLAWPAQAATTILPPGETCFQQATGPVSSGSVNMFIPSTTTAKNTWQDSGQVTLNTNPIQLDANGCAVIYGTGSYRQQIYTGPVVGGVTTGTLLYDVITTDTSAQNAVFWAGTSGGTPNAITVTDAGFNSTDGSVINFIALNTNTASTTLSVSGGGAIAVKAQSGTGPIALTSGCITATNPVSVVYSSSAAAFLLLTPCAPATSGGVVTTAVPQPQGYLTLSSDSSNPIITADTLASTNVYYTPYVGNAVPIWNGTGYTIFAISQLTLALSASNLGHTIYDVFIFSNSGTPVLVTGPAWTSSAAGTGARGTGAGTTQLQRVSGLWVNAVQITGNNGANSYTVSANQATYVGSIFIDQTAGQVSNYVSWGQNRTWSVWNAYNRQPLRLQAGDPTVTYTDSSVGWRASNSTPGNAVTTLTGLPEQQVPCIFIQNVMKNSANTSLTLLSTGIALNIGNITPTGGTQGFLSLTGAANEANGGNMVATNYATSPLGITTFTSVESTNGQGGAFAGSPTNMVLQCNYPG
jgi:hypothetical protein